MTISIPNFFDDKFYFMLHCSTQPSEIDRMPLYEYIELRKRLADHLKRQEEQNKNQQNQQQVKQPQNKWQLPKFKMPSFRH